MKNVAHSGIEPAFQSARKKPLPGLLSAVELKTLEPGFHSDGNGLYLDVQASGSRSWILRTMVRGRRKDIGLGGLSTKSLADARAEAADLRSRAKKGQDILEIRRAEKRVIPTFKEAATAYHTMISQGAKRKLGEQHARNWLRSLEQYAFPVFGNRTVDTIESADVLRAIGPIWNEVPDTARRTLRRIRNIFDYCEGAGHRNILIENGKLAITLPNPCKAATDALPDNRGGEKHHEALPYSKLSVFMEALRKANASLSVKLAFEFTVLTACRTSEVLGAKWEEFDLEARVWSIPAERMKMKQAHVVPLSFRAIEILSLAKEFNDSEFVFPGRPGQALSNMAMLMALRRMEGYKELTVHGFRATFKTWAEEKTTYDFLVIEASLAHEVKGIERHYLRTKFPDLRKALMDSWSAFATAAPAAKVMRMHR